MQQGRGEGGRGALRTISQHLQVEKKKRGLVQPLGFLTFLLKSQERRVPRPSFSATLEVSTQLRSCTKGGKKLAQIECLPET